MSLPKLPGHKKRRPNVTFEATDRAPPRHVKLVGEAVAAIGAGDSARAMKRAQRVLKEDAANPNANRIVADLLALQGDLDGAVAHYGRALAAWPMDAQIWAEFGRVLQDGDRFLEAGVAFQRALQISPVNPLAVGGMLNLRGDLCDWLNYPSVLTKLRQLATVSGKSVAALQAQKYFDEPELHRHVAATIFGGTVDSPRPAIRNLRPGDKIRIAYLSGDFKRHPAANLLPEVLSAHDRSRFEVLGLSTSNQPGPEREMFRRAFDLMIDVDFDTPGQLDARIRDLRIDILIDRSGHTKGNRVGHIGKRPAPVQVSFVAFPFNVGAPWLDYLIADPFVAPPGTERHFTEKLVRLPDCYQPFNRDRFRLGTPRARVDYGLPDDAFVFCDFNGSAKFTPTAFTAWMNVLKRVPGSVLWLLAGNETAEENLRTEARERGVDPERLVFAGRLPLSQHLPRYQVADLFLDTWPYNAHTTASDALYEGLPLVTMAGKAFHARVAGSILATLGLPELITSSFEEYENVAVALATDPEKLAAVKAKLVAARTGSAMFDPGRYTRHLEWAFTRMVERARAGLPPEAFDVPPLETH